MTESSGCDGLAAVTDQHRCSWLRAVVVSVAVTMAAAGALIAADHKGGRLSLIQAAIADELDCSK